MRRSPVHRVILLVSFPLATEWGECRTAEEGNAMAAIADKPVDVTNFVKHCDQRRKYPVLLRVEFQVTSFVF